MLLCLKPPKALNPKTLKPSTLNPPKALNPNPPKPYYDCSCYRSWASGVLGAKAVIAGPGGLKILGSIRETLERGPF